jgi:hypothetical protein
MTKDPETDRRPGEWPVPRTFLPITDEEYEQQLVARARANAERARWELTLGAIRGHLEEQPTPQAVRAASRRWISAIVQLADEVAHAMRNQHHKERGQ